MTSVVPPRDVGAGPDRRARSLTRWSWALAAITVVWQYVLGLVMWWLWIRSTDLTDASVLLTDHGAAGWIAMIVLDLLGIAPAVLGGWYAVRALRLGAHQGAWIGLGLNTAIVVLVTVNAIVWVVTQA